MAAALPLPEEGAPVQIGCGCITETSNGVVRRVRCSKHPEPSPRPTVRLKTLSLRRCDRCGQAHSQVPFRSFSQREIGRWNLWSTCPTTGEPVLMHEHTPTCGCQYKEAVTI